MDDVLEQLVKGWVSYLNEKFGTEVLPEDVTDWEVSRSFPMLTKEQVYSVEKEDRLWDFVEPMPGAAEALQRMIADGHEVYIVTATKYETLKAKMEKVLFRYFPFLTWDQVIITSKKHLIKGDVLIDDGPHNMNGDHIRLLFDARHNRGFDETSANAIRVKGWEETYQKVCEIADEKKRAGAYSSEDSAIIRRSSSGEKEYSLSQN